MQRFPRDGGSKELRMDEQELMHLVQKGDESAFEKIVVIYKHRIVNYLTQMTGDYQRASELAQETFIRVYFKADRYKPVAPLSSWIYAIASNLAKTDLKKTRKSATVSLDDTRTNAEAQIASPGEQADAYLVKSVKRVLNSLHPRYRIPIILKDIEGFSQEEIAQILKRPIGTVKARISRGREYLKRALEKEDRKGGRAATTEELQHGNT
jgi:RNA polymerase sigma-70 factor (ECF subfamily)